MSQDYSPREPLGDSDTDADFATEHDDTTVDEKISAAEDEDPEAESPQGLGGMDIDRPVRPD
jgi:hypothetical protein